MITSIIDEAHHMESAVTGALVIPHDSKRSGPHDEGIGRNFGGHYSAES
ncbi:MAG: hypothetical protein V9E84_06590 [Trichococcus flocculiformis]